MEIDLTGRDALVTGGAAGIGRECALVLAEAGARVAVADIDLEGAQETIETMRTGCTHPLHPLHPLHPARDLPCGVTWGHPGMWRRCARG